MEKKEQPLTMMTPDHPPASASAPAPALVKCRRLPYGPFVFLPLGCAVVALILYGVAAFHCHTFEIESNVPGANNPYFLRQATTTTPVATTALSTAKAILTTTTNTTTPKVAAVVPRFVPNYGIDGKLKMGYWTVDVVDINGHASCESVDQVLGMKIDPAYRAGRFIGVAGFLWAIVLITLTASLTFLEYPRIVVSGLAISVYSMSVLSILMSVGRNTDMCTEEVVTCTIGPTGYLLPPSFLLWTVAASTLLFCVRVRPPANESEPQIKKQVIEIVHNLDGTITEKRIRIGRNADGINITETTIRNIDVETARSQFEPRPSPPAIPEQRGTYDVASSAPPPADADDYGVETSFIADTATNITIAEREGTHDVASSAPPPPRTANANDYDAQVDEF